MPFDPSNMQDLWAAFPTGSLDVPGTMTVTGVQVLKGRDQQSVWFWPEDARFGKPGTALFDEARSRLDLLPDLTDISTWLTALRVLADRTNIDPHRGVLWVPKGKEVFDRKRGSSGKAIAGWSLRTLTKQATFPIETTDEIVALMRALAMTNCACGKVFKSLCPMHGDSKHRPWR